MQYSRLTIVFMAIIALSALPVATKANHAAAGELTYTWISGNTYRFIYKGYFDCSGTPTQPTVYMCATNTCTNVSKQYFLSLWSGTITPANIPNCSAVPIGCSKYITQCDSPSSNLPGYHECWYTADITLNDTCSNWEFVTTVNSRSSFNNVVPGNQYLRTTFNNTGTTNNSSPYFASKSVIYTSRYFQTTLYNHMVDVDGDSVTLEVIRPLTNPNTSNLCPTTPVPVSVNSFTPPISFPNNPIPTHWSGFFIDTNGNAIFTCSELGASLLTFLIKEYRNGKLIGTVMRDVNVLSLQNKSSGLTIKLDTGSVSGLKYFNPGTSISCPGDTIRLCYEFKSKDTNAVFHVSDTILSKLNGASVIYSGQASDSVRVCLEWIPAPSDTGYFPIIFDVVDSTCYPPGNINGNWAQHNIYVRRKPVITISGYPNLAWPGLEVSFQASITPCNNPTFQWQVNGADVAKATKHIWSSTILNGQDNVTCIFRCYDTLCADTLPVTSNTITVNVATSVNEMTLNKAIHLYPNPNNGNFTLVIDEEFTKQDGNIEITNIYGQVIYRKVANNQQMQIELNSVPAGMYLLRATTGDKTQTLRVTIR